MFKRGILQTHFTFLNDMMRLIDPLLVGLSAWLAYYLTQNSWILPKYYPLAIILTIVLTLVLFPTCHLYESWRGESMWPEVEKLLIAWGLVIAGMLLIGTATQTSARYSRLWMANWSVGGAALLITYRLALRSILRWFRSCGFNLRRVIIVGSDGLGENAAKQLVNAPWAGLKIIGVFGESFKNSNLRTDCPWLGGFGQIADYIKDQPVEQIWIAIPWYRQDTINYVLDSLRHCTADIRMVPDIFSYYLLNASISEVAGLPLINLSVSPIHGTNRVIKSCVDRVLAFIILLLVSPLMLIIAIGVKLSSPGPVIFRQKRHGYDGKEVEIWKFRSMKIHRELKGKVTQAKRHDPRLTKFGSFLRRTSLDELPQFVNVLQGRMSIVGPRPHAVFHNEFYKDQIERYMLRHKVKPGITGWAQVNGLRGETETIDKMKKRVEFDLYYIENWSLWLDIKIIILTVFLGFINKNAH